MCSVDPFFFKKKEREKRYAFVCDGLMKYFCAVYFQLKLAL